MRAAILKRFSLVLVPLAFALGCYLFYTTSNDNTKTLQIKEKMTVPPKKFPGSVPINNQESNANKIIKTLLEGSNVTSFGSKVNHDKPITVAAAKIRQQHPEILGEPRPQFIFHIHYHKTGHDINLQYNHAVQIAGERIVRNQSDAIGPSLWSITNDTVGVVKQQNKRKNMPNYHVKRRHNAATGCPLPFNLQSRGEMNQTETHPAITNPSKINLMIMTAPDFLCNLYENDVFEQNDGESSCGPKHHVQFIHMIRDPFGTVFFTLVPCNCGVPFAY